MTGAAWRWVALLLTSIAVVRAWDLVDSRARLFDAVLWTGVLVGLLCTRVRADRPPPVPDVPLPPPPRGPGGVARGGGRS